MPKPRGKELNPKLREDAKDYWRAGNETGTGSRRPT